MKSRLYKVVGELRRHTSLPRSFTTLNLSVCDQRQLYTRHYAHRNAIVLVRWRHGVSYTRCVYGPFNMPGATQIFIFPENEPRLLSRFLKKLSLSHATRREESQNDKTLQFLFPPLAVRSITLPSLKEKYSLPLDHQYYYVGIIMLQLIFRFHSQGRHPIIQYSAMEKTGWTLGINYVCFHNQYIHTTHWKPTCVCMVRGDFITTRITSYEKFD